MSEIEHPKSAVCRLISQKCNKGYDLSISPEVSLCSSKFVQEHQREGNINLFTCSVPIIYNGKKITFTTKNIKYQTKKEAEYCVFSQILEYLEKNLGNNHSQTQIQTFKFDDVIVDRLDNSNKTLDNSNKTLDDLNKTIDNHIIKSNTTTVSKINNIFDDVLNTNDMLNMVFILVDFENISNLNQVARLYNVKIPAKDIHIVKIAGFCSSVKQNADIVVRSNRKDAVDHYIGYLIGMLESRKQSPIIYIISRDKFGSCLQDFCRNVTHCADVDDFLGCV